jgi:hypothetical protein
MHLLILISALFFGIAATYLGLKNFEAWTQVIDLWETEVSPLLLVGHPHFFRYLIAYPGFLLESELPNLGFSIYVSLFFAINVVLLRRLSLLCQDREPPVWAWAIFLLAHMFMNGRGVIAWTAWLLCAILCLRMSRHEGGGMKHLLLLIATCWLAAVSTGVFIVTVATLLLFYFQYRKRAMKRSKLSIFLTTLLGVPMFAIVADYFWVALQKNVEFYGGGLSGVLNMLQHGVGMVLFESPAIAMLLIYISALALILLAFLGFHGKVWSPLQKLIFLGLSGGLFGFTVLTLVIPLFLIYVTPGRKDLEISSHPSRFKLNSL